ncbi:HNH endonuclease [Bacillus safensis]|uniref:HNH endonuclease n=1 Tax=Bacillus safensis TaxID=561879 RepID=UPI002B24DDB1|nr:HNH endonuclease [Bacillus safensis]MEB2270114.1 HNH endonuclease [Bacillus safensis]
MPPKPLRECKVRGCRELTRDGYCHTHADGKQQEAKYYNKHVRDKRSTRFYYSKEWRQTRKLVLSRDSFLCQRCLKQNRVVPADTVHHIVEVKQDWNKRLDLNNLVSLCGRCHNKVHGKRGS